MAIDFANFSKPNWIFCTDAGVSWGVLPVYFKPEMFRSDDSEMVVKNLISELCRRAENTCSNSFGSAPTCHDMDAFSQDDLQRFAKELLENNPRYFYLSDVSTAKTSEQTDADYLIQQIRAYLIKQHQESQEQQNKILERLSLSSNRTIGDFAKHHMDLVVGPKQNSDFTQILIRKIDELQINVAAFLEEFLIAAQKSSRSARWTIFVGLLAVIVAASQIVYVEFWRSPNDDRISIEAISLLRNEIASVSAAFSQQQIQTNALLDELRSQNESLINFIASIDSRLQDQLLINQELTKVIEEDLSD